MKKLLSKTLLFIPSLLLTSCSPYQFYAEEAQLFVNGVEITELWADTIINDDGSVSLICFGGLSLPNETREHAEKELIHVPYADNYSFKFNVKSYDDSFNFRYLDKDYNPLYPVEKSASPVTTDGLNKKNWFPPYDAPSYGQYFYDFSFEKNELVIDTPTEDYQYIVVSGSAHLKYCRKAHVSFTFVIEK